jgi:hypothetical protein
MTVSHLYTYTYAHAYAYTYTLVLAGRSGRHAAYRPAGWPNLDACSIRGASVKSDVPTVKHRPFCHYRIIREDIDQLRMKGSVSGNPNPRQSNRDGGRAGSSRCNCDQFRGTVLVILLQM